MYIRPIKVVATAKMVQSKIGLTRQEKDAFDKSCKLWKIVGLLPTNYINDI